MAQRSWPKSVSHAVIARTQLEALIGGYEAQARQSDLSEKGDHSAAVHIGASPREIALMENTTLAWCHAFHALPLKPSSKILTCEAEYAALQRAKRDDLKIEVVPSSGTRALDLAALEMTMSDDISVLAISWVPVNGGLVNPAAEIDRIANAHNVPDLLNACRAAGQMRIDV